jgi:2'-5' RNA ligase
MPPLRLFFAIPTPADARVRLSELRDELAASGADVKWESTPKLHITLRFLGDTPEELLRDFVLYNEGVSRRFPPLPIRYRGVGCFPGPHDPRVIWAGVEDPGGTMAALQAGIEEAVCRLGLPPERKRFHAHVTLGRVKGRRGMHRLLEMMESAILDGPSATVGEFTLMKSILRPGGSEYTVLHSFPLMGDAHII